MFKKIFLGLLVGLVLTGKILAQSVDYYLPYPGILPDHPLYWLKMVRDRIGLITVTGKTAKAEKLLLYADKRLGAAWALIDGNKLPLGVSTLTKAEKYLEQAVSAGGGTAFQSRLGKAVLKHEEVILRLSASAGDEFNSNFRAMLEKLQLFKDQLGATITQAVEIRIDFGTGEPVIKNLTAVTALEALEKTAAEANREVQKKDYDFGTMVLGVGDSVNTRFMAWIYYVNGKAGDKSADKYELKSGDKIEWRYEKVKP